VWTSQLKNLGHWNGDWNQIANLFFLISIFFHKQLNLGRETATRMWKGQPKTLGYWYGDKNQIISFSGPIFFFIFFLLATKFKLRDCYQGVDRSTKNLGRWDGDWNQVTGFNNLIFFFNFLKKIYWQPNLGHRIAIRVWIGQMKNLGYWNGDQNQINVFKDPIFF
jgi:hypothetical protein